MSFAEDVIAAARSFEGTLFVHQARQPGVGLDCIGLIVCAGEVAGQRMEDHVRYGRRPNPRVLRDYIARNFRKIMPEEAEPGDVLLFWWHKSRRFGKIPQHAGLIVAPGRMIHAYDALKKVQETDLGAYWSDRIESAWRYNEAWQP